MTTLVLGMRTLYNTASPDYSLNKIHSPTIVLHSS